jgi:amino acid transporter
MDSKVPISYVFEHPVLMQSTVFFPQNWKASSFIAAYITIPIFLALYLGHKLYSAIKLGFGTVRWSRPMHEIDVLYGKREMDELEALDETPIPKNLMQKIWFWIA